MLTNSGAWDKVKDLWIEVFECKDGCGPALTDPNHPVCDVCEQRLAQLDELVNSLWSKR